MAKQLSNETLKLNIIINGDDAQAELVKLEEAQRKINRANKDLREEKKKLELQNKKSKAEWERLDKKVRENNATIDNNKKSVELLVSEKKLLEAQNQRGGQRWTEIQAKIQQTNAELAEHRAANKKLIADRNQVDATNKKTKAQWKALDQEIRENNLTITANKARMKELQGEIGITGLTLRQLKQRATHLRFELANMVPGTAQFKKLDAELQEINARLRTLRTSGNHAGTALSRLANGINKYFNLGATVIATVAGMAFSLQSMVEHSAKLEDAQADVMKTTSLTIQEVRGLTAEMDKFNTRTPRIEMLKLAEEAGRLGRKSKRDVLDFVETANMLKVALGDDLGGEEAIRDVGKLTEQYRIGEKYARGFGRSMEMLGSSINTVSASGSNQAAFLVDYLKRMSGVSDQANIAAQDQLGFAAALDESGQRVETSATAMGKVIIDMFTDSSTYAQIAGKSQQEFAQIMRTDANEALLLFLDGLNGNNEGLEVMAHKFADLGMDGNRAITVLATLAANTEKVRLRQAQANEALEAGTSLIDEYNIKNNNLAANVDKVSRALRAKFISSGLVRFLERSFASLARLTDQTETFEDKTRRLQSALNLQLQVLKNGEFTQQERARLIGEINDEYGEYLPRLLEEKDSLADINAIQKEINKNFQAKILYAAFEEEIAEAIKEQKRAAESLYKTEIQRQELREKQQTQGEDLPPGIAGALSEGLVAADAYNEAIINKGAEAEQEIEEKYTNIFESLGLKFEEWRKKLSGAIEGGQADPDGDPGGGAPKVNDERIKAEQEIQDFLLKASASEEEQIRAKYQKLMALAEKYKIDLVDELTASMNQELIEAISEEARKEIEETEAKNADKIKKEEDFLEKQRQLRERYGLLTDEDRLQHELEMLQEAHDQGLLSYEEFLSGKAIIEEEFRQERLEKEAEDREEWLAAEQQKWQMRGEISRAAGDLVSSLKQLELSKIDEVKEKDFEVSRKKNETEEQFQARKEQAEKRYTAAKEAEEQKRHEIAKKYAYLEAMATVSQIVVNTALAVVKSLPNFVLAGIVGLAGGVQSVLALKEAQKIQSYNDGLYDVIDHLGIGYKAKRNEEMPSGLYSRPTFSRSKNMLVAEKRPEIVVDPLTTQKIIQFHPEVLDTINAVRQGISVQGYNKGNYPNSPDVPPGSSYNQLAIDLAETNQLLRKLIQQSDRPLAVGDPEIRKLKKRIEKFNEIEKKG